MKIKAEVECIFERGYDFIYDETSLKPKQKCRCEK